MTYLVTCIFSLKNASVADYRAAYAQLLAIGLRKTVVSEQAVRIVLPLTLTIGQFTGTSAAAVQADVRERVSDAFNALGFVSDIFVLAGTDWAWGSAHTPGSSAAAVDAPSI